MHKFELPPIGDGAKSFWKKAYIIERDDGVVELQSYNTIVCRFVDDENKACFHGMARKRFERLWAGYSATTMRHINAFLRYYGFEGGGKAWWLSRRVV